MARHRRRPGRKIHWRLAVPGTLLMLLGAFSSDIVRFGNSIQLYGASHIPELHFRWQLERSVQSALDQGALATALRSVNDLVNDAPDLEHLTLEYRLEIALRQDRIEAAAEYYRRLAHLGRTADIAPETREILRPFIDARRSPTAANVKFEDVTGPWHVPYRHSQRSPSGLESLHQAMGSGVASVDLDVDGWLDLVFIGGMEKPGHEDANRVFRGLGPAGFADATVGSGLGHLGFCFGVVAADLNGDEMPELYITCKDRNHLLLNQGNLRFANVTRAAGVAGGGGYSTAAAFGDIDGDEDLDLYVARWVRPHDRQDRFLDKLFGVRSRLALFNPQMYFPDSNHLFRNRGDGTFEEITDDAAVGDGTGRGLGVALLDFDGDFRPEIFVANDESPNRLFRNRGDGTFVDISAEAHMYDARAGMGVGVQDFDHDGQLDLVYTNFRTEYNAIAINELERGVFSEQTERFGLAAGSLGITSWGVATVDFNNDREVDMAITNGHPTPFDPNLSAFRGDFAEHPRCLAEHPLLYVGEQGRFRDITPETGDFGAHRTVGRGLVAGDLDRDGRVDLVVSTNNDQARIFRNTSPTDNRWLTVRPRWRPGNRSAIGARVEVTTGRNTQSRVLLSGGSYLSQNPFETHFGLGTHDSVAMVRVIWPDGTTSCIEHVAANQVVDVDHRSAGPCPTTTRERREPR